jgi:fucose 4-O-acetylase-like acetyltransferase
MSGFLFNSQSNQIFKLANLWKKQKRLLIPYLSFSALNLLMKMMMPSLVNKQVNSTSDYLKNTVVGGHF